MAAFVLLETLSRVRMWKVDQWPNRWNGGRSFKPLLIRQGDNRTWPRDALPTGPGIARLLGEGGFTGKSPSPGNADR